MGNLLFIPGLTSPVAEIRQLLFGQGQPGGSWIPSLSAAMIAANTFGSGVTDILDLSGNNNPFSQATSGSRGAWFREPKTGRRQLLLHSGEFANAIWTKANSNLSTGTLFLDGSASTKITENTETSSHLVQQSFASISSAYTYQILVRAEERTIVFLRAFDGSAGHASFFDLSTGVVSANAAGNTATITSLGGGWFRCTITRTLPISAVSLFQFGITTTSGVTNYAGDGVSGVSALRPQMELGSTATAYQLSTTAFDVTESGQRDCYGVWADGADDRYATANAVNLSTTGQLTLWAAIRSLNSTIGSIFSSPQPDPSDTYLAVNRLSTQYGSEVRTDASNRLLAVTGAVTQPAISVIRARINLSLSGTDRIVMFVNGVGGQTYASPGTMTRTAFFNNVLHLFALSNGNQPASVQFFGGIIAGGGYSLATEQRIDRILSRITPTVNL
jgi:hypothetical protein